MEAIAYYENDIRDAMIMKLVQLGHAEFDATQIADEILDDAYDMQEQDSTERS